MLSEVDGLEVARKRVFRLSPYKYFNTVRATKEQPKTGDTFVLIFLSHVTSWTHLTLIHQRPVVQNFVSLTLSLSPLFVNFISTSKANTLLFCVEKM